MKLQSRKATKLRDHEATMPRGYNAVRLQSYETARLRGREATKLRGYEATRLRGCEPTKLRGYEATRSRGCEPTKLRGREAASLRSYEAETAPHSAMLHFVNPCFFSVRRGYSGLKLYNIDAFTPWTKTYFP